MAKQLNVNLAFTADTSQVKTAINELQSSLSKIASMNTSGLSGVDATKIKAASNAAKELSIHLNNAFNANTGNFDLSKLDKSLKTSGANITELSSKLLNAGATGQQAFVKLAQTVSMAERPVISLSSKLTGLWTTLKNTARWQLSSSVLHGFMGAYSQAIGYVKDLNESLTDIRIVTGKSIEDMSRFAIEANKAAKVLSTTTNEYAQASLIFFQQGLDENEVAKRAAVTIKMANVAGQSAQIVSDQLTAVWNNFYDGSKSLEYYADVMTALGAATASSTDEIAGGLEKFAAIADTIGLSYEYAASALATITANTRQSEDVVGTALKTIFARIQGLNLGETLDDGTTLNKYSEALQKIGISIFDSSGELKNMDAILNEMGDKWETLNKAQQTALAQTVAGTRQYTQLVALMDNWDAGDSDSMKANLETVANATGALSDQADIYAESWEAARDKVKASLESIYSQILDDKFFIDINNGFASMLDSVSAFIKGFGGIKNVVISLASIFLTQFAGKIQPMLNNLGHSVKVIFQSAETQAKALAGEMNKVVSQELKKDQQLKKKDSTAGFSVTQTAELEGTMRLNDAKSKMAVVDKNLTDLERQRYQMQLQMIEAQQKEAEAAANVVDAIKKKIEAAKESWDIESTMNVATSERDAEEKVLIGKARKTKAAYMEDGTGKNLGDYNEANQALQRHREGTEEARLVLENYTAQLQETYVKQMELTKGTIENSTAFVDASGTLSGYTEQITTLGTNLANGKTSFMDVKNNVAELSSQIKMATGNTIPGLEEAFNKAMRAGNNKQLQKALDEIATKLKTTQIPAKDLEAILNKLGQGKTVSAIKSGYKELGKATKDLENKQRQVNLAVANFNPKHVVSGIEAITKTAGGLGQVAMAAASIRSIFQAWNNDDLTIGEKLTTTVISLSMALPMLINGVKSIQSAYAGTIGASLAYQKVLQQEAAQSYINSTAKVMMSTKNKEHMATLLAESAIKKGLITEDQKNLFISNLLMGAKKAENAEDMKGVVTEGLRQAVKGKTIAQKWAELGVTTQQTLAESKNSAVKLLNAAASKLAALFNVTLTAAKTTETGAVIANTAAWYANPVMWIALVIVGVVAALAALIAIISGVSKALSDAYNADAIAADRAEESAAKLADRYSEVKTEYENMISAMEEYQGARDALSELTKGTEEYEEALQKANRQALELIENYGDYLDPSDYNWEGDQLVINDEALAKAKAAKAKEENEAYAAAQMANVSAKEARNKSNATNLKREMRDDVGLGTGDKIFKNLAFGMIPGFSLAQEARSKSFDLAVDKVLKASADNANLLSGSQAQFTANMMKLGIVDLQLIHALYENKDSLQDLGSDIRAAEKAREVAAQNTANEIMADSGYDNTTAGRMALEAGGKIYNKLHEEAKDKYDDVNLKRGKGQDAWDAYAAQMGLEDLNGFKVTSKSKDQIEYEYVDEEGQKQTAVATREMIAETLAAAEAAGQLEGALGNLRGKISELNNSDDVADHALAEFMSTGNLEGATKEEFDAIKAKADSEGIDAALGLTGNIFKDNKMAQEMGYKNAREYKKAFEESLEMEWKIPEGLGENIANKLTAGAANKVNQTYEKMGETGGQAYLDALDQIEQSIDWDSLTPEEQAETWDRIANIDWSSWDAGEQAADIVEEMGGHLDTSAESWKKNVDAMRDATDALPDLEKLRETMSQVKDISEGMALGNIISKEDYETLIKYNEALSDYFTILSDGSAMFTGDILDYQQAIKETNQEYLKEAIRAYDDRLGEMRDQVDAAEKALGGSTKNLDSLRDTASDGTKSGFDKDKVEDQLAFLESQNYSAEQVAVWREKLGDGELEKETLNEIASAVDTTAESFDSLKQKVDEIDASLQGLMNEVALEAEDAAERMKLLEEGLINEDAYNNAAMAAHNKEKWEGMDPEEVEAYSDYLQEAALASGMLSDELKDNAEAAEDVALYTQKMNNGIETLADNFDDWSEVLKKSNPASEEYAEAIIGMKNAISDLLGVSEEFISNSFVIENMEDIAKAAEGDADAIDRLAIAAAKDILVNIELEDEGVREELYALHDELAAEIPNIQVGATLDDGDFLRKAAQIVETAGMSVDEANAYFRSLGFEPNFETKEVEVTSKKPIVETYTQDAGTEYKDYTTIGPDGEAHTQRVPFVKTRSYSKTVGYTEDTEIMTVPSLTTDGGEPNFTLTRTNAGAMNNFSSVNAGGSSADGSGSSSKPNKQSKSKIVDRYKEVNDSLDDMADALDDAAKAADRLYGKSRIDYLKKQNGLIQDEIGLLKQKKAQALANLSKDASAIGEAASQLGVSINIGADGNISNYTSALSSVENQINSMVAAANSRPSGATESEQETIDDLKEKADLLKEAISQYDETKELIEDIDNELVDKMNAWQDNNYEILTYELELKLEINDQSLETIDYYLNKISDDFYRMAESAALMVSAANSATNTSQLDVYLTELDQYKSHLMALENAYLSGQISQAAYAEGIKDVQDNIYDNLNALVELDKTMMSYYGDTLDMAGEELAKYTDRMEHSTSVLDHYESIMSALGKETDYKAMDVILRGQAETLRHQADVAKETLELYTGEAEEKYKKYQEALAAGNNAAAELYYKEYEAAQTAADEAEEDYLDKITAVAEKSKAILENALESHARDLEKALSGGVSFDVLNTQMERAQSLQEEYLTTTNQIYETNKMMRTAQQEIDKISNTTAKNKLKNFITETKQLQNQNKLSQYELDIQQAKYDLLLAEIALQDAQNAKTTVRLKRDSSGNFSYVYTADQQAINEAEQKYEDAQNRLYNIGLEGANNYTEKYQQTLQEFYDTMTEMSTEQFRSQFATEEEYQKAVQEAQEYYYAKLEDYSHLYSIAVAADSRVTADAWSTDFSSMMKKSEDWQLAVNEYLSKVRGSFTEWELQVDQIAQETGLDLGSLKSSVEAVKDESNLLKQAITDPGGVIDALDGELGRVSDLTGEYAYLRNSLQMTMSSYESLATSINNAAMAQLNLNSATTAYNSGSYGGGSYNYGGTDYSNINNPWGNSGNNNGNDDDDSSGQTVTVMQANGYLTKGSEIDLNGAKKHIIGGSEWWEITRGTYKGSYIGGSVYDFFNDSWDIGEKNVHGVYTSGFQTYTPYTHSFDTGGYTGEWGPYGKMAMLHEKELVLNAQDTENFLASLELLDNITRILDLQSANSQMSNLTSPGFTGFEAETLEQEVHIEASFPNVQNRNEIEEAFKTLINEASQYANRKTK